MTISTTTSRALYAGNGVTTIFSFPYLFLANGDLEVRLIAASGASTVLTLTTDYTVTGANNDAGGSVTMIVAPASGEQLLIRRIVDLTQETAYPSGDQFPAESHERALDKLTMMVQQHDEEFARTLQLPPESDVDASTINVEAVEVVAGIAADVSAVAAIDDEVVIAADNIAAILAAPAEAAAAAASALAADASADAAALSAASIALPLPVASGGTGSTTATNARSALGLVIGTNVLAPNGSGASLTGLGRKIAQIVSSFSGAVATGTTATPWDDSAPQITEGDQYYTVTITPQNASSLLEIDVVMNVSCASPAQMTVALHQDAIADALAATTAWNSAGAQPVMGVIKHYVTAGSTTARTYRVRVGNNAASTVTVNGTSGARRYGGVHVSGISVKEYLP